MRALIFLLLLTLAALHYKLWLGDGSIVQWKQLKQQLAEQEEQNQKLTARNQAIEADIIELKSGEQALEEQARAQLGMVKDGEVYYQFAD